MKTEEFDYDLPQNLIAQSPAIPRESCRLLALDKDTGLIEHRHFTDILEYLREGDLLVVNDTKVMPARLLGKKRDTGLEAEVLLLHKAAGYQQGSMSCQAESEQHGEYWEALVKPGRRLKPGSSIDFNGLTAEVVDWVETKGKGRRIIRLVPQDGSTVAEAIDAAGVLPLPPYIKAYTGDTSLYQTVYAHTQNSAAAPTAGLHFSEELLAKAQEKGCTIATVCLEIGLDTFRTVEEEDIADHVIHSEFYSVSEETVRAVQHAKAEGGRVIAVGTTAVRALESAASCNEASCKAAPSKGASSSTTLSNTTSPTKLLEAKEHEATSLYITPGYEFKVVDALITNFHVPRSTLLMLVSAFASHNMIFKAYDEAIQHSYRFLSFGDAMLIH